MTLSLISFRVFLCTPGSDFLSSEEVQLILRHGKPLRSLHDLPTGIMPIERRCAIVPGSDFLSPEEAQLILRHGKSLRSLALSCSDQGLSQVTRQMAKPSCKNDQTGPTCRPLAPEKSENRHQFLGHVRDCPSGPYPAPPLSTEDSRPSSSLHVPRRRQVDHSLSQEPSRIRSDNKRKHVMEWEDLPRQHPAEVLEVTPHVSELDSGDGATPMEADSPDDEGPFGTVEKVSFYVHNLTIRVRKILTWVHSPKPKNGTRISRTQKTETKSTALLARHWLSLMFFLI